MRYPEQLIRIMREDLTRAGIAEARTPEEIERAVEASKNESVLVVVNSVCGCAAGKARPGVVQSLQSEVKPDRTVTVFAGGDVEAVARLRELTPDVPPSSPAVYLFRDGRPVYIMSRRMIENSHAEGIAQTLREAYEQHCSRNTAA